MRAAAALVLGGALVALPSAARAAPSLSPWQSVRLGTLAPDAAIVFVRAADGEVDRPGATDDVWAMAADGTNPTQLTFNQRAIRYEHAAISPDRRFLAVNYHVSDGGPRQRRSLLWVYDLTAGRGAQLVPDFHSAGSGGIDWDGEGRLYFAAAPDPPRGSNPGDVYRVRWDGSGLERLTDTPELEADVAVSEDGSRVAFVRAVRQPPRGYTELWTMKADGTDLRRVYTSGTIREASAHDPEFAPDGRGLVFSQVNARFRNFPRTFNTAHDVWVIDGEGGSPRRITPEGGIQIIPDWLGDRVLHTDFNEAEGYVGLAIVDVASGERKRIGPAGARAGKWIPARRPEARAEELAP